MITNGRGINAEPRASALQRQLTVAVEHIAYLLPMHHILALKDRYSREILERGVDEIEGISHPAYRRVGMIARYHWIAILLSRCRQHCQHQHQ